MSEEQTRVMSAESNAEKPKSADVAATASPAQRASDPSARKPKRGTRFRRHSTEEKLEKLANVDAQLASGVTLKDAVKSVRISDQTYYHWKKATEGAAQGGDAQPDVDISEFDRLDEENRRLKALLVGRLRSENEELRKRLGL